MLYKNRTVEGYSSSTA